MRQCTKFHPSALHQATQIAHTIVEKFNAENISLFRNNLSSLNDFNARCEWNYCSLFVNYARVCKVLELSTYL